MNEVELSPLRDNEIQFAKLVSDIEVKYNGNWDDAVHDSYGRYVKQVCDYAEGIKVIRQTAENIQREVGELNIPGLVEYVDVLRGEAESI